MWKVFTEKLSKEELTEILRGKHSIKDVWITKAFAGNERFIQQIVHKLFPESLKIEEDIIIKVDLYNESKS